MKIIFETKREARDELIRFVKASDMQLIIEEFSGWLTEWMDKKFDLDKQTGEEVLDIIIEKWEEKKEKYHMEEIGTLYKLPIRVIEEE